MSVHPVRINTEFGLKEFDTLQKQQIVYASSGRRYEFKARCMTEFEVQSRYLEHFLDNKDFSKKFKMDRDDEAGFQIFNEQSDVCSILKYFGEAHV